MVCLDVLSEINLEGVSKGTKYLNLDSLWFGRNSNWLLPEN
jgi:hypothetical protein